MANRSPRILSVLLSVAAVSVAVSASAQTSDPMLAESLFDQGRKLMAAGDYAAACPKFKESQRLDPGVGTLLNLGMCYEKAGKTASAWLAFKDAKAAASKAHENERKDFAANRLKILEPKLSHLVVAVPAGANLPDLTVMLDNHTLPSAVWGTEVPVDPGVHHVDAQAPGKQPWSKDVTVGDSADMKRLEVPALLALIAGAEPIPPQPQVDPSGASNAQSSPTLGYVVGGVGLAALGVGAYFGLQALSTWDDRNAHCPGGTCDETGSSLEDDANRQANISNVGLGLGLVGVGVGAYMLLLASSTPDDSAPQNAKLRVVPSAGKSSAGLSLSGRW